MSNEILKSLLKEYEQKKTNADLDLIKRKEQLYLKLPRLQEIENELNSYAIFTAKNILKNSDKNLLDELQEKANSLKLEKQKLLELNGINLSYLKPFYECDKCNDTGYITQKDYKTSMCNCLKQKLLNIAFNKSNIYNLDKQNFNTFNENIFSSEVDIAKYKLNISPRKNIINIKNKCIEFVESFDNPEHKNLLFTGNTGLR